MAQKRQIDWLNHFLEFIVVIIGILIAFQLNTCREKQKEQIIVEKHITNIISESEFNKGMLETAVKTSKGLLAKIDSLSTLIDSDSQDVQAMNRLSMNLLSIDYLYLKKNAYNSLVETGDIRFIEDFELQYEIVGLYEYYHWVEGIDTSTRETYGEQYFPYVVENLDLATYRPQDISVYTNKQFQNYLSVYNYSMTYRLQKQKDVLTEVSEFLENIKDKS